MSLWYGTGDAPAPDVEVPAGAGGRVVGLTITVGVQPMHASNRVDVYYRVNGGDAAKIPAELVRSDVRAQSQYFTARFPTFSLGAHVEYGAMCSCSGRQLPSPGPPQVFPSSFRVGSATDHPTAQASAAPGAGPASAASRGGVGHVVEGLVLSPGRGGLAGVRVEIVDKNTGPHVPMASAVTDASGRYHVTFGAPRNKARPDLGARVYAGQTLLGASAVRYDARAHETLDVVVPAGAMGLPSEYEVLTAALAVHHHGKLGDLQETDEREDITYLARKSGWDARAIAFAALAEQLSGAGKAGLPPALYYALFRAGFPTEADALYETTAAVAAQVWEQAIAQGVIARALEGAVAAATKTFETLAAAHLLDARPATGLSSLRELLQIRLGADAHRAQTFADLFTRFKHDLPAFWTQVEKAFGVAVAKQLQLDGQLGHLTLNNAPLIGALYKAEAVPLASVYDLVRRGYHRAARWEPLIGAAIPKEIAGDTIDHRRSAYAEHLAAQMREASPIGVLADLVQSGALPVADGPEVKNGLRSFFDEHHDTLDLGAEPVERYLARSKLTGKVPAPVVAYVKQLQRVYQITPSDQALQALLEHDLGSAYAVTRYDAAGFARAFGHAVGGEHVAHQIHAKAMLVHGAVLNVATSHLAARGTPRLGTGAGGSARSAAPAGQEVTLDRLFGSMDFCACPECRSILSPAAYLVDLLHFIDYPHAGARNPQAVLLARRPDIQHLPLTCENTNTALPYIDLVNETLEYFVANRMSLAHFRGHTTAVEVTSDELMASPQFVTDAAYRTLTTAPFPPPLPFDRALGLLRLHLRALDMPLHDVMAVLHAEGSAYAWRDILMERVGLSRAEYRLLTDGTLPLPQIFGITEPEHHGSDHPVAAQLASFPELCRRARVSYEELTAIVRTHFINPDAGIQARVLPLSVPFTTIRALKTGTIDDAAFTGLLPPGLDPSAYGGPAGAPRHDYRPIVAWLKNDAVYARIMGLITIAAPEGGEACSVAGWEIRYSNPDPAHHALRGVDLVRLNRFIRLWRKLGLTIEQTDEIVSALYPKDRALAGVDEATDLKHLDEGFSLLLARIGFLLQIIELLALAPQHDLPSLLACWAPIGTSGPRSLYRKMFLSRARLHQDPAFTEGQDGSVLQDSGEKLWGHEPALRSALNLTGAELALIAGARVPDDSGTGRTVIPGALGFDAATPLTLDNVSAIHRRGWLARALRLSVVELLRLIEVTGLDPFAPLDPGNDGGSAPKTPGAAPPVEPPAIRFIRRVQALRAASLKPVQALYLLWNHDLSGKSAPPDSHIAALARALRADFAVVETHFALVADPNGDIAKGLMTLVYGADAASTFFGLLDGTMSVNVPYAHPQPALPQPVLDAAPGRLRYDHFRKQLTFGGVLDDAGTLAALNAAAAGTAPLLAAIAALSRANHRVVDPFFAAHPKLPAVHAAYVASKDTPEVRRTALLAAILPDLKRSRKQEQALTNVTAAAGVDPTFARALLLDAGVLHAAADPARAGIADVIAIEALGLSAQFFLGNDPTAAPDSTVDAVGTLSYAPQGGNTLPAAKGGGALAGVWSGFLDAPKSDFYDIQVTTDAGATVALEVGGADVTVAQSGGVWSNASPIALKAGALAPIRMTVTSVKDTLSVAWQTGDVGSQPIPAACLYPATLVDRLRTTYLRFLKAASLGAALSLTADEMGYLAASGELAVGGQGWLNGLTASGTPDAPTAARLAEVLAALLDFARLKAALSPADGRLLAVLKDPAQTLPNGDSTHGKSDRKGESLLLALTRWDQASLAALLRHFFGDAQLSHLSRIEGFRRVFDAYAKVTASGVSAAPLLAAATNDPKPEAVGTLEAALRARHAEADWLTVVKPIHDAMRTMQRDALVAFVLQRFGEQPATRHIDTPDKLFEHFLMDVEMAPCSATSRVRLALSSIQLFVERVLRGLEPGVDPSHVPAAEWEWMKRYRVWQANREVFLWPENWLDPDLRDDPSPFFKETMSALLQGDLDDDGAAAAFLTYLTKLEDVAKLEPCALHHVAGGAAAADDVTHVIARTAGAKRKHYYRRQEAGSWTPWEEVKLDIEDHPLTMVDWNGRLLLLWVRVLKQAPLDPSAHPSGSHGSSHHDKKPGDMTFGDLQEATQSGAAQHTPITVQAMLCWSERYNGAWQATKTSDVNGPMTIGVFPPGGPRAFDRSRLELCAVPAAEGRLLVSIFLDGTPVAHSSGFTLYNTHSLPVVFEGVRASDAHLLAKHRAFTERGLTLRATYEGNTRVTNDILRTSLPGRTVEPQPGPDVPRNAPLFFEDSRHAFYVTIDEEHHALARFKGFGFGRAPAAHPAGKTYSFPPVVTPHQTHHPRAAHPIQYGGHEVGHAGAVKRAPGQRR